VRPPDRERSLADAGHAADDGPGAAGVGSEQAVKVLHLGSPARERQRNSRQLAGDHDGLSRLVLDRKGTRPDRFGLGALREGLVPQDAQLVATQREVPLVKA
jgi:hypothetical protein